MKTKGENSMNNSERLNKWTYEVKERKKGFKCFITDKDGNMCLYQNKTAIKLDSFSLMLWCNNQLTYHFVAGRNDDKPYIIIKGTNKMLFMEENQTTHAFGDINGDDSSEKDKAVMITYTTSFDANIIIATNHSEVINYFTSINSDNFEASEQFTELLMNNPQNNHEDERSNESEGFKLNSENFK